MKRGGRPAIAADPDILRYSSSADDRLAKAPSWMRHFPLAATGAGAGGVAGVTFAF